MSNTKKFFIIVFTVMLVISLQFNTALTHKMNNGFSLTQLMENIFVPEVYADQGTCNGDVVGCDGFLHCEPDGTCYVIFITFWFWEV